MTVRKGVPFWTLSNRSEMGGFCVRKSLVLVCGRSQILTHLYEQNFLLYIDFTDEIRYNEGE